MIQPDKVFLIQDILPNGVLFNIPPFLNNCVFNKSEAKAKKSFVTARIRMKRAYARLKDFKISTFIPQA